MSFGTLYSAAFDTKIRSMETMSLSASAKHADFSRYVDERGWIKGAEVEAGRIAALVEAGMTLDQLIADYPNLGTAQVEAAVAHARAHPEKVTSFPRRTVKSFLREDGSGGLAEAFEAARNPTSDV